MIYEKWMTLYLVTTTKKEQVDGIAHYANPDYYGVGVSIPYDTEAPKKILVQTRVERE